MLDEKFPDVQQVLTSRCPPPSCGRPDLAPSLRAWPTTAWRHDGEMPKKFPAFVACPHEQRSRGPRGDGPCNGQARRRACNLLERERPSARRPGFFPYSSARRTSTTCRSGCTRRALRPAPTTWRAEIEIRDLAGARMAVRDEHRHGAHGVLAFFEKLPPSHHHASLGRNDPVFSGPPNAVAQLAAARRRELRDCSNACRKNHRVFRMFYGDTVLVALLRRCAAAGFLRRRPRVFASDCPSIRRRADVHTARNPLVEDLKLPEADKRKIYFGNALKLLKMPEQKKITGKVKQKGAVGPFLSRK